MPFGFNCPDLNGQTQNISAFGTPAFVVALSPSGSRVFFQGATLPGVPQYASSTITRAAMVAGLVGAGEDFTPIDFLNLDGATITINGDGEIASITPLPASLLPPAVPAACRIAYSSGAYCDVQGTVAAVEAAISAGGGGGAAGVVGPLATVYVEPSAPTGRGNDATGQRGNAARPFATLTAALAAMQSGDTLELAAGVYLPPAGPVPAALLQGAIVAPSGAARTVILGTGSGLPCLDFGGTARDLWTIRGVRLENDPGALCLSADGTGAPAGSFFVNGSLALQEVVFINGDALFRYVGTLVLGFAIAPTPGTWTIDTCNTVLFLGAELFGGISLEAFADNDDPLSPAGVGNELGPLRFDGSSLMPGGTITLHEQAGIYAAPGSVLSQVTALGLTRSVAGPPPFGFFSQVTILGSVQLIDFGNVGAFPDVQGLVDLTGCVCSGNVTISQTPGATTTLQVAAGGASFGGIVTIGEGTRANLRTASFSGGVLASIVTGGSSGRVIPPTFALFPAAAALPVTAFPFGFRLDGIDYVITTEITNPAAGPVATTLKTQIGFELTPAAAAGELGPVLTYWGT